MGESALGALWLAGAVVRPFAWLRRIHTALLSRLVDRTGLFDEAFYLQGNPDVAAAGTSALRHYVAFGDREGRAPHALFDPVFYRLQVRGRLKYVNALLHYAYVGWLRRLSPSPWFDAGFYLAENRDLVRAGLEPLKHYLRYGALEGRSPSPQFDGAYYLRSNPDVLAASENPLLHYLRFGHLEGRKPRQSAAGSPVDADALPRKPEPIASDAWAMLQPRRDHGVVSVDVLVPVYKGRIETLRCLYSVLTAKAETAYEIVVIDDASPDPDLEADLQRLADMGLFTLLVNPRNRGFVYTVNRGMNLHPERDVVLLNADTEVFDGWVDRLAQAAKRNDRTGTVTPLSNNATICSYPQFLQDNPYPLEISYPELDSLAATVNAGEEAESPTAVGFCTYIRRACLDEVGLFDEETFGKGYGEENEFSQRAIARGWRNVIAGDVFVYHSGSASFQGERAKRVHAAMEIMSRLYPSYYRDVAEFIEHDPIRLFRERLDWGRLRRQSAERNVLIVVHGRGGGTEQHVQEDVRQFREQGLGVFFLRPIPSRPTHFALSHHAASSVPNLPAFAIADTARLAEFLRDLRITEVHTHSLIDAVTDAPRHLKELIRDLGVRWEVNLHDYKVICPRINLTDDRGRYCGEPNDAACNRCLDSHGSSFGKPDIREWRLMHHEALLEADVVLVPDAEMAERLERYFPGVHFDVSPHDDIPDSDFDIQPPKIAADEPLHVVVIGALSYIKGYDVLLACARDAKKHRLPIAFTLMGYSVNDRLLEKAGVRVAGRYLENEGLATLSELHPHVVWLPSRWPETYSYTLSLALRYGRPVFAFDIGAIAARLRRIDEAQMVVPLSLADSPRALNEELLTRRADWIDQDG